MPPPFVYGLPGAVSRMEYFPGEPSFCVLHAGGNFFLCSPCGKKLKRKFRGEVLLILGSNHNSFETNSQINISTTFLQYQWLLLAALPLLVPTSRISTRTCSLRLTPAVNFNMTVSRNYISMLPLFRTFAVTSHSQPASIVAIYMHEN